MMNAIPVVRKHTKPTKIAAISPIKSAAARCTQPLVMPWKARMPTA